MSGIAAVVGDILLATVVNDKVLMPKGHRAEWAFMALSVLLASAGVFFLALALNRYLEEKYPPDMAALASALLVFAAAFLAGITAYRFHRKKASAFNEARTELGRNIRLLLDDICGELDEPVRENPKTAVALAALAGFFTANQRMR